VLSSGGAIAGLVLSGVLLSWMPWRWVFAVPAVIAAVAVAVTPRVLPAGAASAGAARRGGRSGWSDGLSLVRGRLVPLAAVLVCAAVMASAFFLLSLYLQQERGLSPAWTSAIFCLPVPAAASSGPLAARLLRRYGARPVLTAGLVTAAGGLALLGFLGSPYAGLVIFPFGTGLAFAASVVTVMRDVGGQRSALAGAMVNTAMETGPPLGLAVLTRVGYPLALRGAAIPLLVVAMFTLINQSREKHQ
jgi:predicted MFS family arabinose efflux permease